ncbi:MAG TPA: topoisomerase [Thermoplasmatales archaeon]|nr:topoisomerase [Thermoplasmatales archaeon]HEX16855.1 topoisomerase [Thermoplasmatales archaeon]
MIEEGGMNPEESLEMIERALIELIERNREIPVLVEGERDALALKELGLNGEILIVQCGKRLSSLCDFIAENYKEIIILTDWDRKGWQLYRRIERNLRGRTRCIHDYRLIFARYSMVKDVQSMPSFIKGLRKRTGRKT